jgi:hypothetical protein
MDGELFLFAALFFNAALKNGTGINVHPSFAVWRSRGVAALSFSWSTLAHAD